MSDDLGQRARELALKHYKQWKKRDTQDIPALAVTITDALRTIQAETREADAQVVNGLIGKDSGNWNRAIVYAVEAIRAQGGT